MHGAERTKLVAQSLMGAADWIEKVVKEVRGFCSPGTPLSSTTQHDSPSQAARLTAGC